MPEKILESAALEEIFLDYELLAGQADELFAKVRAQYPDKVVCHEGCGDCCHALFDLSLVEAMALNRAFNETYGIGQARSRILEQASEADRQLTKMKKQFYRETKDGAEDSQILLEAARARIRCPLLDDDDKCSLYHARPITCRLYGVPTAIGGKGHVCGLCGFEKGGKYPTVYFDRIQDKLSALSLRIAKVTGSRFRELHHVFVPVSMALLTRYDEDYLGIGQPKKGK